MDAAARFCPACGAAVAAGGLRAACRCLGNLMRPRYPRVFGGVCSGLALHYGWDITTVRLLWVLCVLFAGDRDSGVHHCVDRDSRGAVCTA